MKKKDTKYKIDYKNCMKRQCEQCRYEQYCFKEEKEGVANERKAKNVLR